MIRTRDFLLYIVVLSFIVLSAIHTGLSSRVVQNVQVLFGGEPPAEDISAYATDESGDTAARWSELRTRLAAGDGYLADAPAVFTSVDQTAIEAALEAASTTGTFAGERSVSWCGAPTQSAAVAAWPSDASLQIVEGQRTLTTVETETVTTGSTTETVATENTVLTLPIRAIRSTFDSCVPDSLIGVTPDGAPLSIDTASRYQSYSENQLVGYTRDGFALYGPSNTPDTLDACGGRYVNGGYQYHVRSGEDFVIACYAGIPVDIAF